MAAYDSAAASSGIDTDSSFGKQVNHLLGELSDLSQQKYTKQLQLLEAMKGADKLPVSERNKYVSTNLENMGAIRVHDKVINLGVFTKDVNKNYAPIEASAKGLTQNSTRFFKIEDGKKVNYFTSDSSPIANGRTEKGKVISVDREKIVPQQFDYKNKRILVNVPLLDKEGKKLGTEQMFVELSDANLNSLANMIDTETPRIANKGVSLEDLLLRADGNSIETFAQFPYIVNGSRLGMPYGTSLSYKMRALPKSGTTSFTVRAPQGEFVARGEINTRELLEKTFSNAYRTSKAELKSANPNSSETAIHNEALKRALNTLR